MRLYNTRAKLIAFRPLQRRCFSSSLLYGSGQKVLDTIDLHCAGEPARVIINGFPNVPGDTMYDARKYIATHLDAYRTLLLTEPRGYPCQNANIILPSKHPQAKYGFVIMEQGHVYPLMSGHNTMCVATALLERGMVPMEEPITKFKLEAPGGLVGVTAKCAGGKAVEVQLENVESFVMATNVVTDVPELGPCTLDVAYGGMIYAVVEAHTVGLGGLDASNGKEICRIGEMIKVATREQHDFKHPVFRDYVGPDILVFTAPPRGGSSAWRNAVVMSNGKLDWNNKRTWTAMIDRSPCGTGTSAVMAVRHHRGLLKMNEDFLHQGIVGTQFTGRLVDSGELCGFKTVKPTITGSAWITLVGQVIVDPTDPFPSGYTVGDIWSQ